MTARAVTAARPALWLIVAGLCVAAGASAAAAGGDEAARDGRVRVVTSGNHSELRETIPITSRAGAQPKVAMSLTPHDLPGLGDGDRLRITAELQTTNNCRHPSPLCVSRPYKYSPRIGTRIVLARNPRATGGPKAMPITKRRESTCGQSPTDREHHCVAVFRGSTVRLNNPDRLPCALGRCHVNFVVDSHHRKARSGDVLLLGIDRAGKGHVSQDKSRLNAIRFRGPAVKPNVQDTHRRLRRSVDVEEGSKFSIYSLELRHLREDQQLTVDAAATAGIAQLPYATFFGSQLILATRPAAVHTTSLTRRVAEVDGEANEGNGFNCTQQNTPCRSPRVGTLDILQTPTRAGHVIPLYLNFVLRNAPKRAEDRPGDRMRILRRGGIRVERYPAGARG